MCHNFSVLPAGRRERWILLFIDSIAAICFAPTLLRQKKKKVNKERREGKRRKWSMSTGECSGPCVSLLFLWRAQRSLLRRPTPFAPPPPCCQKMLHLEWSGTHLDDDVLCNKCDFCRGLCWSQYNYHISCHWISIPLCVRSQRSFQMAPKQHVRPSPLSSTKPIYATVWFWPQKSSNNNKRACLNNEAWLTYFSLM